MDHCRTKRRAVAAIFLEQMLNDLFTALMLEIHVDIRRLVSRLRDEPLEHHRNHIRRGFRHAQRITDDRVRRAATPLTENAATACKLDNIMHGQKIAGIIEVTDQLQLFLDKPAHMKRYTIRIAALQPGLCQHTQALVRRDTVRDLIRILVLQLIKREPASVCNTFCIRQRLWPVVI